MFFLFFLLFILTYANPTLNASIMYQGRSRVFQRVLGSFRSVPGVSIEVLSSLRCGQASFKKSQGRYRDVPGGFRGISLGRSRVPAGFMSFMGRARGFKEFQ